MTEGSCCARMRLHDWNSAPLTSRWEQNSRRKRMNGIGLHSLCWSCGA